MYHVILAGNTGPVSLWLIHLEIGHPQISSAEARFSNYFPRFHYIVIPTMAAERHAMLHSIPCCNTFRPVKMAVIFQRHFRLYFLCDIFVFSVNIRLKFVCDGPIDNMWSRFQEIACAKPLPMPMMTYLGVLSSQSVNVQKLDSIYTVKISCLTFTSSTLWVSYDKDIDENSPRKLHIWAPLFIELRISRDTPKSLGGWFCF